MTAQLLTALVMAIWRRGKSDALLHRRDAVLQEGTAPRGVTMTDVFRPMYPFVALQVLGLPLCI